MSRAKQVALVFAGYLLAFVASGLSAFFYDRSFSPADSQAMSGMIAGGTMFLAGGVFCLISIVPTGLALWFLRESRRFWAAFSFAGLLFAIVGLALSIAAVTTRGGMSREPLFALVSFLGIVQMFGSPLWIGGFLLFALLAPARDLRRRMLVAAAIEVGIAACGLLHFFAPVAPI
ncbi:MAG: hypothetical protein HOP12_01595 [Candidatus Eisenbacteria bacterium]|uniref:Uncharacterized protein n=1 Tax=Eiseniibacteriota bacterium TaxID=2212470 RepID=A0A849SBU7_UNCEI|nr:hypothetical protein [Candidatus Eisenbacteria bacterium]